MKLMCRCRLDRFTEVSTGKSGGNALGPVRFVISTWPEFPGNVTSHAAKPVAIEAPQQAAVRNMTPANKANILFIYLSSKVCNGKRATGVCAQRKRATGTRQHAAPNASELITKNVSGL